MKPIIMEFDNSLSTPLYIQLYTYLKQEIIAGELLPGEKLPSLRRLSKDLSVSITTTELAYDQLLVEGYIKSKPQSGFYIADIAPVMSEQTSEDEKTANFNDYAFDNTDYKYDLTCFNFSKWKKCVSRVFNEYSHLLLFESDPQGEAALRFEISKYIFSSRGVVAKPENIVIGAGTQQLTTHLCRILRRTNIEHIATEDPGYKPVQNIFTDNGFALTKVPVTEDGILVEKLPANIPSAVYVSPSNQFPTGSVMPAGRRYELLKWASDNSSYILEDDYDSELRYFGKPVPALASLDKKDTVVYLGSFSSTLFPAVKISYMVLPKALMRIFNQIKSDYTQTCSKTEQLSLALFMEYGYYYTNIKKLRALYSQKLNLALDVINRQGKGFVEASGTTSGISIILKVATKKDPATLCEEARSIGLNVMPVSATTDQNTRALNFYYNQIPLEEVTDSVTALLELCRQ